MSQTLQELAVAATLPRRTPDWPIEPMLQPLPHSVVPAPRIAVLIPCRNEEATIGRVVSDFHAVLPDSIVYVYDNNSTDRTSLEARAAGAVVRHEPLQGKGHVVRRMFADVEADLFILVDGDATYDAKAAPAMLRMLLGRRLDMVTAARVTTEDMAYRRGHRLGNAVLTGIVRGMFGGRVSDVLSGYRAFSRRFVKSFPALSGGFETETEFTVHALELRMPIAELAATYRLRPSGSKSKLCTWSDGLRILRTIVTLVKEAHPLLFFAISGTILLLAALALGGPVVMEFLRTGLVPRLPTAVLATGMVLLSAVTLVCGLVLESVERGRKELKRLAYLAIAAPPDPDE